MQQSHFEGTTIAASSNDYHILPPTEKQILFAQRIASRSDIDLPDDVLTDRHRISHWIDSHKAAAPVSKFSNYPSSKQFAFAERIARIKRRHIPQECLHDRGMMSKWIDRNL